METEEVPFHLLEEMTNGFSEDRELGAGAFGTVYKGVTKNGEDVAVKMLHDVNLDDKQFQNEFNNLSMLKHPNTVQVLGYCYETKHKPMEFNGMMVLAEKTYRALCFEYLPNGSLEKHLADVFHGFDWHTRYKIVKGTCEGLKYLHNGSKIPIYHLDLKPANILLDKEMVPKIADFGLSMMFRKEQIQTTQSRLGTLGYQPPEHIEKGQISDKFDIFSLGVVMIRILSGNEGYSKSADMSSDEFIDLVQNNWKDRLQKIWSGSSLDGYCKQVKTCTEIALECIENDSEKRPDIVKIINKLNEVEALIGKETCSNVVSNKDNLDQTQQLDSRTSARSNGLEFVRIQETSPNIGESIIGRDEEKEKIIGSLLANMKEKITILPVYGIGGIGKTTFAKLIYDHFKDHSRAWVYVSQIFDLNRICHSILSQLSGGNSPDSVQQEDVENRLKNIFSDKKILIVLDDLWEDNPFQLEKLKAKLSLGDRNNTTILVTTRSEQIAKKICMNHKPYDIKVLTPEICWEIIKQRSAFEARYDREHLEDTGKDIADKCCGVPLVARSVGFMLKSMTSSEWKEVNQSMLKDATSINGVLPSLKLSYDTLSESLKSCFTYCASFPKGHKITKDDIVYQWICLGFIKPTRLLSTTQLCDKYIMQLLGLSFLQHSESHKIWERFTMHDLVHDLARSIIADEILDCTEEYNTGKGERRGCRPRYACLTDSTKSLELYTTSPEKIRAMTFHAMGFETEPSGGLLSSAMSLQVLDLSEFRFLSTLPDSLGQLKQLRYLNASGLRSSHMPDCITKLTKLLYLNLSFCYMEALPESIGELKDLLYLDIAYCRRIDALPKTFQELKSLVYLDLSNCALHMGNLTNLAGLSLQYLNLETEDREGKNISIEGLEVICTLTELRYLDLSGYIITDGHFSAPLNFFFNLTSGLLGCNILKRLPKCKVIMDSPDAISLAVHADSGESSSNIGMLTCSNPRELKITRLEHVKSVKDVKSIELTKKERITKLRLEWSGDSQRSVEDVQVLAEFLPSSTLTELTVAGYSSMSFPAWVLDVAHYLPNLVTVELCDLSECKNLPPLGQLPNLKELTVARMNRITIIDQGFYGGVRAFPKLDYFRLCSMENLEAWITVYSHGDDDVVDELMFPMLNTLSISDCPKLRMKPCPTRACSWRIWNSDNVLSSWEETCAPCPAQMDVMSVEVRSSKVPLDQWRLFRCLTAATLSIDGFPDLTSSPTEMIKSLHLGGFIFEPVLAIPSWVGNLTSLEMLMVTRYKGLEAPLESMKKLTSLRVLVLYECSSLETLPEWLRELISLQELCLRDCRGIRVLPEWLGDLTSLQKLEIDHHLCCARMPKSIQKRIELGRLVIRHHDWRTKFYYLQRHHNRLRILHGAVDLTLVPSAAVTA